jgi:hypothetical protein
MARSKGYNKLADFMVVNDYGIFRQFKSTANRDILFLQAEIITLENEYEIIANRNINCSTEDDERHYYNGNWQLLSTSGTREYGSEQWDKALQIRGKLKEYCTTKKSKDNTLAVLIIS